MIKKLIYILIICNNCFVSYSQYRQGQVLESISMKSKILNREVNFSVYLPSDYQSSSRSYPVVYLLHGYSDNETSWIQFGEINSQLDKAIAEQTIPPMIIIMPDGGVSFYVNNYKNDVRWEDMFIQEFIPYIESIYRIRKERNYRALAGLSMGGYGSIVLSLKHPDLFGSYAAFSSALFTDDKIIKMSEDAYKIYGKIFGDSLKGELRINESWKKNNPFYIVKNNPEQFKNIGMYLDCGDDDRLTNGNCMFHLLLKELNVNHQFIVRDGEHNWQYWRTGIIPGLRFIGEKFHK